MYEWVLLDGGLTLNASTLVVFLSIVHQPGSRCQSSNPISQRKWGFTIVDIGRIIDEGERGQSTDQSRHL